MIVCTPRSKYLGSVTSAKKNEIAIAVFKSAFSSSRSLKKFPLLAAFHRAMDGALIGIVLAVGFMFAVTLHAQYLWTLSFSRLETTRDLNQRLLESTAILESHFLNDSSLPEYLVPTKAEHLIYLDLLPSDSSHIRKKSTESPSFRRLVSYPIRHGY